MLKKGRLIFVKRRPTLISYYSAALPSRHHLEDKQNNLCIMDPPSSLDDGSIRICQTKLAVVQSLLENVLINREFTIQYLLLVHWLAEESHFALLEDCRLHVDLDIFPDHSH